MANGGKYKLIRTYDTCCDKCGNWASGMYGALRNTQLASEKFLTKRGWKVVDDVVLCKDCIKQYNNIPAYLAPPTLEWLESEPYERSMTGQ